VTMCAPTSCDVVQSAQPLRVTGWRGWGGSWAEQLISAHAGEGTGGVLAHDVREGVCDNMCTRVPVCSKHKHAHTHAHAHTHTHRHTLTHAHMHTCTHTHTHTHTHISKRHRLEQLGRLGRAVGLDGLGWWRRCRRHLRGALAGGACDMREFVCYNVCTHEL